jgi:hypothetical protein
MFLDCGLLAGAGMIGLSNLELSHMFLMFLMFLQEHCGKLASQRPLNSGHSLVYPTSIFGRRDIAYF